MHYPYDPSFTPPAPVVPIRVGLPGTGAAGVAVRALVDSGADLTVVPRGVAAQLRLPAVGEVSLSGVGRSSVRAVLHAARIEAAGREFLLEVLAVGDDALVGRDLLNRCVVTLRGPDGVVEILPRS